MLHFIVQALQRDCVNLRHEGTVGRGFLVDRPDFIQQILHIAVTVGRLFRHHLSDETRNGNRNGGIHFVQRNGIFLEVLVRHTADRFRIERKFAGDHLVKRDAE